MHSHVRMKYRYFNIGLLQFEKVISCSIDHLNISNQMTSQHLLMFDIISS